MADGYLSLEEYFARERLRELCVVYKERALENAASALNVDAMEAALKAGADATSVVLVRRKYYTLAELVVMADKTGELVERQIAALQLLAAHGGLSPPAANAALLIAAACVAPCATLVGFLLEDGGADAWFAHHERGATALHRVARGDVAQLLINAGADVEAADGCGMRPLHACCDKFNAPQIIRLLLAAGADVDARDRSGRTALEVAIAGGFGRSVHRIARLLLDAGADPTLASSDASAPLAESLRSLHSVLKPLWATNPSQLTVMKQQARLVTTVARTVAWRRRRRMLVAICGRYGVAGVAAAPAGSSPEAVCVAPPGTA